MSNAIADKLQSITNCNATIIKFPHTDSDWQHKIKQSVTGSLESVYLVIPHKVDVLATVIKTAYYERWNIMPCGNGSKLDWGGLTKDVQLVVSTQKCDRIIQHAVDDLTITVEAGITLAKLQATLKATNQFLPIDPAFPETATIGGILATADTGSLRQRYGGIRDLVLGISFVRGDGEIAKAGGRVVKNVAGYDLMKLFIGSYGTLGIITQVTFRTYPIPQASQTLAIAGKGEQIAQAIKLLKNSSLTPTAADLITASVAKKLEITEDNALLVRFQAIPESIQDQTAQLATMLDNLAVKITPYQAESEQQLWHQLATLVRTPQTLEATICKFGILSTEAMELLQQLKSIDSQSYAMIHIGSGIGMLQLSVTEPNIIQTIREFCQNKSGFLSVLTAPQNIKQQIDIWGYSGNALEMMTNIKQKFDPKQILNCDRFMLK
ncbi:FAD/FMN-dependent dehydrogenase [Hyella patelloides LEGE 07179]|uniref:FAD/FMN-dependent dehydrogenase n=1 Tax=Hyella patelloides LEGE 07179 TaxID=945734 RepID=A0A563VPT4_9CYAN|nr:FAD-binding oxidoreductase [Hyella patelloides]VEP13433.1 FAD/FMN-dependent dehydrogenase [Hyella patelloides LEGE 07179]